MRLLVTTERKKVELSLKIVMHLQIHFMVHISVIILHTNGQNKWISHFLNQQNNHTIDTEDLEL